MFALTIQRALLVVAALGVMGMAAGQAHGDTLLFSNLGPGDVYTPAPPGWFISNTINPRGDAVGWSFTPTNTTSFSRVELAVGLINGTNSLSVQLRANSRTDNIDLPGTVLENFIINNEMPSIGFSSGHLVVAPSTMNTLLDAGTKYWITVLPGTPGTNARWNFTSPFTAGLGARSTDGGATWFSQGAGGPPTSISAPAFAIYGVNPIPEPSTLVMAGSAAMICLVYYWRGRKRAAS